jgi:hypothetical protein
MASEGLPVGGACRVLKVSECVSLLWLHQGLHFHRLAPLDAERLWFRESEAEPSC